MGFNIMQSNHFFILISIVVVTALIYLLSPILMPFFVGTLLAYLTEPLVKRLMRFRLSRKLSVTIVFIVMFCVLALLILLLIPLLENQIQTLTVTIPNMVDWMQNSIVPWIKQTFGINDVLINVNTLKSMLSENLSKAGGAADWMLKTVLHSSATVLEWTVNIILIPVVMFYLLCDWTKFVRGIRDLFPRDIEPTVARIMDECDDVLSAFFRGQFIVVVVVSTLYSIGLTLVGLQIGLVIGVVAGIIGIVPYLGFIVGITVGSIAALVQFNSFSAVLMVWAVFIIVHAIENIVLLPRLMGNRIGLHPVAVIFAILAGGCLFGFIGVLVALPVAAVIAVCIRHLHREYRKSDLYKATE
jgi:predicted PurR-regulated permease PerM